ncbi:hypothetical protein BaRGS_00013820 [Batillaria attramentaria]|uniref:Uncharacterized protein n=1 Tax=Batillaria attramentaria TaxID=370345 RepID=A0ABD0L6N2_9CAEN
MTNTHCPQIHFCRVHVYPYVVLFLASPLAWFSTRIFQSHLSKFDKKPEGGTLCKDAPMTFYAHVSGSVELVNVMSAWGASRFHNLERPN